MASNNNTSYIPMPVPDNTCKLASDIYDVRRDILTSGYDRTSELLSSAERQQLAGESRDNRIADHVVDTVYRTSANNLDAIERNGAMNLNATQAGVNQISNQAERLQNENVTYNSQGFASIQSQAYLNGFNAQKNHGETLFRIKDTQCDLKDTLGDYFHRVQGETFHSSRRLERQAGDYFGKSQVDLVKVENSLGRLADSHFAASQLQSAQGFAKVSSDVKDSQAKLELQAAQNTASIQLEAQKTKLDIISKMAECCCEIKEKISASDASTKVLIQSVETAGLRDQLQQAQTQNLVFQACGSGRRHGGPV